MKRTKFMAAFITAMFLFMVGSCFAQQLPPNKLPGESAALLPALKKEIDTYWSSLPMRTFPAGVIDQESNWKSKAKLKTSREFGCGLGQHTIAYNSTGGVRFDALAETKRLDKSLEGWTWADCYNTTYQLRATVLKLKSQYRDCTTIMSDESNALKCDAAKYNGGAGAVATRVRLCRMKQGCNPKVWEGHLNLMCSQSTIKQVGYGESFCEINAKYPGRVFSRMPKFNGYL